MQWPSVKGRIVYSHGRGGPQPETLLWYEYHVDGRSIPGVQLPQRRKCHAVSEVAEAAAKRYAVGRAVPVYYNPGDPEDALLEPGIWWGNFVAPGRWRCSFGMGVGGQEVCRNNGGP